jgi:outer membrane receptor protein involved in Fe transport
MKFSARMRVGLMAGACSIVGVCTISPAFGQDTAVDRAASSTSAAQAGAPGAAAATPSDCSLNPTAPGCAPAPVPSDENPGEAIIVTGSRIARPNISSPAPITSISGATFFQTGNVNIGDVLDRLPQLHNSFNSQNSAEFIGTQGLNLLDLRGLGTSRTLVLINGRRQVTSGLLVTGNEVDVNTIPTDLIERVDVETGGTSSVYGSDAIAGVVNFVLKQNYQGFQVKGQSGISTYGDAGSYYGSVLAGKNFGDGRGNIVANFEYAKQNALYASDRDHYSHRGGFVQTEFDPAGTTNGSDGIPDYTYYSDIRSRIYSDGGLIEDPSYLFGPSTGPKYIFNPNGSLVPLTSSTIGLSGNSGTGGNGSTFRNGDQLGLLPMQSRYTINVLGHYEVSSAFVPYFEAKYYHGHVIGGSSGPSFGARGSLNDTYYTDNAYLTPQALGIIRGLYRDGTFDSCPDGVKGPCPDGINDADEYGFYLGRNNEDLGSRIDDTNRKLYRIVVGARGDLGGGFSYDVSGNYSKFIEHNTNRGNLDVQRYLLATDAVRDPASGNIVCRAQLDPNAPSVAAALGWSGGGGASLLASDIANCVPFDPFGNNAASAAAKAYVAPLTHSVSRADQLDITASINGSSENWFELPGGPIRFSLGVEYRRETQFQSFDNLVTSGVTFLNAIQKFDPPSTDVKEAFAEIDIPVIKDKPFFHRLDLTGAARVSRYKGSTGTVWAYNGGGSWAPIPDITFRANYSRAVRAPTLVEQYQALSQNFADVVDPCASLHIGEGTSNRPVNCAAAGIPTTFNYVYDQSLEVRSGGNPDLKAETSNSITFGGLLQPRFVPGLTLSVDYYKITVNNVIATPDAQDILNNCYDLTSLNNEFCGLFQREGANPTDGEKPFQIVEGSLQQVLLNYAKLKTTGIDAELDYNRQIGSNVTLSMQVIGSVNLKNNNYLSLSDPSFYTQNLYNLSYPKVQVSANTSVKVGKVTLGYQVRYIGKMVPDDISDIRSVDGRPPQNADYTDFDFFKPVWYHDIRLSLDVNDKFNIYGGVDNVANKLPPLGLTGTGTDAIYDNRGRYMFMGVTAKF